MITYIMRRVKFIFGIHYKRQTLKIPKLTMMRFLNRTGKPNLKQSTLYEKSSIRIGMICDVSGTTDLSLCLCWVLLAFNLLKIVQNLVFIRYVVY